MCAREREREEGVARVAGGCGEIHVNEVECYCGEIMAIFVVI